LTFCVRCSTFVPVPDAAATRTDHELQMLGAMVDCAYRLSTALGEAANAETDRTSMLKLTDGFLRGFQAVRLGIRLSMALRAPPKPAAAVAAGPAEGEALEVEKLELERAESAERLERPDFGAPRDVEREREGDYEPVSLSRFLATLGVVATEAERVADRLPADVATKTLPALRGLLARAEADPSGAKGAPAAAAVLARPRPPAPKAALLSSASAAPARPVALRGPNLARPPPRLPR